MSDIERRIEKLGIELPQKSWEGSGTADAVIYGDMLYLSAHLPVDKNGVAQYTGKVGADIDKETAYQAARLCGLNMLATIKEYIGDLDRVESVVKVLGLVNSGKDFAEQPYVVNGFSHLMVEVFGRRGQHARSAMGAFALPQNVPVIVDAVIKLR